MTYLTYQLLTYQLLTYQLLTYQRLMARVKRACGVRGALAGAPPHQQQRVKAAQTYFMLCAVLQPGFKQKPEFDEIFRKSRIKPRLPVNTDRPEPVFSDSYRVVGNFGGLIMETEWGYAATVQAAKTGDFVLVRYQGNPVAMTLEQAFKRGLTEIEWPAATPEIW